MKLFRLFSKYIWLIIKTNLEKCMKSIQCFCSKARLNLKYKRISYIFLPSNSLHVIFALMVITQRFPFHPHVLVVLNYIVPATRNDP